MKSSSFHIVFSYLLIDTQIISRTTAKLVVHHFMRLAQIHCPSGECRMPGGTLVHIPRLLPSFACHFLFSGLPAFSPSTLPFFLPAAAVRTHPGVIHLCCFSWGSKSSWPDLDLPAERFGASLSTLDNQGGAFKSSMIWGVRYSFFLNVTVEQLRCFTMKPEVEFWAWLWAWTQQHLR